MNFYFIFFLKQSFIAEPPRFQPHIIKVFLPLICLSSSPYIKYLYPFQFKNYTKSLTS